jgi:hypothetical protein
MVGTLVYIELLLLLVGIYYLFLKFKNFNLPGLIFFKILYVLTFFTEILGKITAQHHIHNEYIYNVFVAIEFVLLVIIMDKNIPAKLQWHKWSKIGLFIFFALYMAEILYHKGIMDSFVFFSHTFISFYFIVLGFVYYYRLIQLEIAVQAKNDYVFWLVTGIFLYQFASFFINLFFSYIVQLYLSDHANWGISVITILRVLFNVFFYSAWLYAFICKYRETISSSSFYV